MTASMAGVALTDPQRRIWFDVHGVTPGAPSGCVSSAVRLTGLLDNVRLQAAVAEVAVRHDVLGSVFRTGHDGEPYRVPGAVDPQLVRHDLAGLDPETVRRRVAVVRQRDSQTGFDLERQAPLRLSLLRFADTDHLLLVTAHPIAWDDRCLELLLSELGVHYGAAADRVTTRPAGISMPDAATGEAPEQIGDGGFWAVELADAPIPVEVAAAAPDRGWVPGSNRADEEMRVAVPIDGEILSAVADFAAQAGVSGTAVWTAAHSALIARHTGAVDLIVAMPTSVRPAADRRIGQHTNTVLLRTRPVSAQTFNDYVVEVAATLDRVHAHRGVGIDAIVAAARPGRTADRDGLAHLTRIGFAVGEPVRIPALGAVATEVETMGRSRPQVSWHVAIEPDAVVPHASVTTSEAVSEDFARAYLGHLLTITTSAITDPDCALGDLPVMSADEQRMVTEASRGPRARPVSAHTLPEMLAQSVQRHPDVAAIIADTSDGLVPMTYRELDERSSRLARRLIGSGIGTEDVVALAVPASTAFLVAVLAIGKAGGAYLPIDPSYPRDRIDLLLADARPALCLTADDLADAEMSAASMEGGPIADTERVRPLRPGNLAYLMYTSGSTGVPKGVPVAHAAISDHVVGFGAQWTIPPQTRVLLTSSVGFDASLLDIFVTLSVGATIVVGDTDRGRDLPYLADLIGRADIGMLHVVPSLLRGLVAMPQRVDWRSLTHVAVGGDALTGALADRAISALDVEMRNYYGPTEAVVSATHHQIGRAPIAPIEPIGRPNRNVDAYLLDERLTLVPDGVVGEIYLGGAQLARGYLDRCAQTAAHFVADPFSAGGRLYRTGDLARRRRDGTLEFLGRADDQVKVRGYRIEPAEVAAVLTGHPDVIDCHVTARPGVDGELHAHLVARAPGQTDPAAVHRHAIRKLPQFMVPVAYSVVASLPRNSAGKVDVGALPVPKVIGTGGDRPPVSVCERRVAALFGRFFDAEQVYADDSFFDLGGHSLSAHRLLAQLRAETGVTLGVSELFAAPTVAGIAAVVEQAIGRWPAPSTRDPKSPAGPLAPTAAQILAWRAGADNVIGLTVRVHGGLDSATVAQAIDQVTGRHDATRLVLNADADGSDVLTVADRADWADWADAGATTFASGDRLWRFRLTGDREVTTLQIVAHRSAADDFSIRAVLDEIAATIGGVGVPGTPVIGFGDYARWYALCTETSSAAQTWWRSAYAGLSAGSPRAVRTAASRGSQRVTGAFRVDPDTRRRLQALATKTGIAERELYEAAVAVVAVGHGADRIVAIGSETGRLTPATATVVGPVTAPAIARYDLTGDPTLAAVLDQSRLTGHGADSAPGVPVEVHRTVALVALASEPRPVATVRFTGAPAPVLLHFGDAIFGEVEETSPPAYEPVLVTCTGVDGGIDMQLDADADLFGSRDIAAWCAGLDHVLAEFIRTPERRLSQLDNHGVGTGGPDAHDERSS
ncbi:amino acid adenylation domain-containing protein [Gordonia sp. ABSL1-1]|uniref:non-ribosomal peptide synthetase n=1 Tax=Gordonia sp. ABSL1-1 TaxID=3053923 RepID=UPI002573619A|nr:amino acid adenylation domain-containing protein [Gordonia sp. ABSL1-1]MDL9937474.1 amino acid adenylation domain-containing protein [Gordonia sp. ABSL1-1]